MIFITLLAGFVPLLQVTFIVVGRITTGLLAVKDRDKLIGSLGVILIMWDDTGMTEEVKPNFRTPPS